MKNAACSRSSLYQTLILSILAGAASAAVCFFLFPQGIAGRDGVVQRTNPVTVPAPALDTTTEVVEALTQQSARLDERLSLFASQLVGLQRQVDDNRRGLSAVGVPHDQPFEPEIHTDLTAAGADTEEVAELDTFSDALYAEAVDQAWSDVVDDKIVEALARPELQSLDLVGKRCGTTLCQVEFWYDNATFDLESVDVALSLTADRGQGFARVDEEQSSVLLYFAREHYPLFDLGQ